MTAPADPLSSERADAKKPDRAITPERREDDPGRPGGCDATPGGRGQASGKPDCPEGYPEEQQTDDPAERPDRGPDRGPGGVHRNEPVRTRGDRTPDQRER